MPEGQAVLGDRKVRWKPADITWPKTGGEIEKENEFALAGFEFTDTPPDRWSDHEYDIWAEREQIGTVTKVDNGLVFIQLDKPFRKKIWTVAYPEGRVCADPALDDVSKVWEEWVETLVTGPTIPDVAVNRDGSVTTTYPEPEITHSANGTA
jgi:hypothetical protein